MRRQLIEQNLFTQSKFTQVTSISRNQQTIGIDRFERKRPFRKERSEKVTFIGTNQNFMTAYSRDKFINRRVFQQATTPNNNEVISGLRHLTHEV